MIFWVIEQVRVVIIATSVGGGFCDAYLQITMGWSDLCMLLNTIFALRAYQCTLCERY